MYAICLRLPEQEFGNGPMVIAQTTLVAFGKGVSYRFLYTFCMMLLASHRLGQKGCRAGLCFGFVILLLFCHHILINDSSKQASDGGTAGPYPGSVCQSMTIPFAHRPQKQRLTIDTVTIIQPLTILKPPPPVGQNGPSDNTAVNHFCHHSCTALL